MITNSFANNIKDTGLRGVQGLSSGQNMMSASGSYLSSVAKSLHFYFISLVLNVSVLRFTISSMILSAINKYVIQLHSTKHQTVRETEYIEQSLWRGK